MNGEKGSSDKAAGLISAGVEVVGLGVELQNGQLVVGLGGELQNGQLVVMEWMASKVSIGLRSKKTPGRRGSSPPRPKKWSRGRAFLYGSAGCRFGGGLVGKGRAR